MAQFLHDAHAYKVRLGFNGTLLLEPKPQVYTRPVHVDRLDAPCGSHT